jgi:hypothetical protein
VFFFYNALLVQSSLGYPFLTTVKTSPVTQLADIVVSVVVHIPVSTWDDKVQRLDYQSAVQDIQN